MGCPGFFAGTSRVQMSHHAMRDAPPMKYSEVVDPMHDVHMSPELLLRNSLWGSCFPLCFRLVGFRGLMYLSFSLNAYPRKKSLPFYYFFLNNLIF